MFLKKKNKLVENIEKPEETKALSNKNAWYKDKKIIGTIILIIAVAFQLFAFLKVPFFTTIHGYTIGMLFGWYNPFFYLFLSYVALVLIFGSKIRLPKWVKLNGYTYWIAAISIMFIGASTGFYQSKGEWTTIGSKAWHSFDIWFSDYRQHNDAWFPANTNGGLAGVFFYSLFSMISSGIGAFIIAIITLAITISFVISGSWIAFYKSLINKRKVILKQKEIKIDKETEKGQKIIEDMPVNNELDIEDPFAEEQQAPKVEQKQVVIETPKENKKQTEDDDFPFENPFDV